MIFAKKYIGGEFATDDIKVIQSQPSKFSSYFPGDINGKKRTFLETGADSITYILKNLSSTKPLLLWIPEKFCTDTINRVTKKQQENVASRLEIRYYDGIDDIDIEDDAVNLILLLHFNCFQKQLQEDLMKIADATGSMLIEDFTHAPLEMTKMRGAYGFSSLRKFLPLEIAVLYSTQIDETTLSTDIASDYLKMKKKAGKIKLAFLANGQQDLEKEYLELFVKAEEELRNSQLTYGNASEMQQLEKVDFDSILNIRRKNYQFLHDQLNMIPGLHEQQGDYMYYMIKTKNRDRLRKHCFDRDVFPAIHWLDAKSILRNELLSFHIDHRYEQDDMKNLVKIIKQFYAN